MQNEATVQKPSDKMKGIDGFLVRSFIRNPDQIDQPGVHASYGFLEAWVSIIGNLLLFVAKFILGLASNSIALIADSFHTLSDVVTSICVLVGFAVAKRPPDPEHPFGHGRSETIATLVIAVLLLAVGFEFLVSSVKRTIHPPVVLGTYWLILIMLAAALFKEWMARFSIHLGRVISSTTLIADAWHHRSDAIAALMVALSFLGAMLKIYRLDGFLGIGVSLLIIYTGFHLARNAIECLMGRKASADFEKRIVRIARRIDGVKDVHEIEVHDYGSVKAISIHIEVKPDLHVTRAHDIGTQVQEAIDKELGTKSTVHIEPYVTPEKSSGSRSHL